MNELTKIYNDRRQSQAVLLLLALLTIEGFLGVTALLIHPSDPESRLFLGYSGIRLLAAAGLLVVSLIAAALTVRAHKNRPWLMKISGLILGKKNTLPYFFLVLFLFILGLVGVLILSNTGTGKPSQLAPLVPVLVWPVLLIAQLALLWAWFWLRKEIVLPPKAWDWAAVVLLFVIAILPRASLTTYGLPYQSVWDEVVTYPQALRMLTVPGLEPVSNVPGYGTNSYGDLLVYITAAGQTLGLMDGFRTQRVNSFQEYVSPPRGVPSINGAVNESGIPLRYPRLILALINSLSPVFIFIALRKYLKADIFSAFGGALLYAFLSREVLYYSSFILPDALATTLFLIQFLLAWLCLEDTSGRISPYFLCGFLGGMILSTSVRLWTVASLPFLALALARDRQRGLTRLFAIPVGLAAGFLITSPYALIDLPNLLSKWTSFSWYHDLSWSHRLSSLAFYFQGMFKPGFNSSYIDTNEGSIGFGLLAGLLALLGLGKIFARKPCKALLILAFSAIQLYSITPVVQRFTRHALVLYPLVCILAGMGLSLLVDALRLGVDRLSARQQFPLRENLIKSKPVINLGAPAIVLAAFLLLNTNQFTLTFDYLRRASQYKPVQVRAAEYLSQVLQPGDKVGILDLIPWVLSDLKARHIPYEQIKLDDTSEQLQARGITYVVGTDQIKGQYGSPAGTMWENAFKAPGSKLAEFGTSALEFEGYPVTSLYIFVARLPGSK
jgi:hypothetical protein